MRFLTTKVIFKNHLNYLQSFKAFKFVFIGDTFPSSKRKNIIEYDSDEIESQHENLRNSKDSESNMRLETEPSKSNIK